MSDLFIDLYRYRQRERKENQEDWLTECLAATMRAMPAGCLASFFATITGQAESAISAVIEKVSISTQVTIERSGLPHTRQRPDMLVWIGSEPWLLFENKVAHAVDEIEKESVRETQLHRYGEWLSAQAFNVPFLRKALVFITHHTPVPADYANQFNRHISYVGLDRLSSSWGRVARAMLSATASLDHTSVGGSMASAFNAYLEHHGMANEYPRFKDISALSGFIEVSSPLTKLIDDMYRRVERFAAFSGNSSWAQVEPRDGSFSAWRYLAESRVIPKGTFLQTGIWFPDLGNGWYREEIEALTGVPMTDSPKMFLLLGNDDDDRLSGIETPSAGDWQRPNTDLLLFRDFASFVGEPNQRAHAIFTWLDIESAKLKAVIER